MGQRVAAIVPAAGKGERLGLGMAKALHRVGADSLLQLAVRGLVGTHAIDLLVVAAPPEHLEEMREALAFLQDEPAASPDVPGFTDADGADVAVDAIPPHVRPQFIVVPGGATRQQSVANALAALPHDIDVVLVHDAARALTPTVVFERVLAELHDGAAAVVPALPVADTVKVVEDDAVMHTLDRASLRAVQTPQGFTRAALERAHMLASERGLDDVTDDAGLAEQAGIPVRVVAGDPLAFKITRPLDLVLAEAILGSR